MDKVGFFSRPIKPDQLPVEALKTISSRQKSYIDEFRFYETDHGIAAWYAGELLAFWNGTKWK
jgi:hypothetical protein